MKGIRLTAVLMLAVYLMSVSVGAIENISINAKASILVDAADGHAVYEKNADEKEYPASLTKLMTALLVVENVSDLSEVLTANKSAYEGLSDAGSTVGIKAGEKMSVDNLLVCLLVASANEAANILAERVSGSVSEFVNLMNTRAGELGLTGTHFVNPSGLHDEDHYTTARDMAKIALEARKNKRLCEICSMDKATIPATNMSEERFFYTTNSLISQYKELGYKYSLADGMKTGSTTPAGYCLVATAKYKEQRLISVVLGCKKDETTGKKGSFVESKKLLIWGFENFKRAVLLSSAQPVCEVHVESAWERDYVVAHITEDYSSLMPKDYDADKVELVPESAETLEAPIKKGDEVGKVSVRYDGKEYAVLTLVAADDVKRSIPLYIINHVKKALGSPIGIAITVCVVVLIILYIMFVIRYNKKKRRHRRRYRY